jgi:hypothetical protein
MDMAIAGRLFGPLQSLPLRPSILLPRPWPWPRPKHRTTSAAAADAQNRQGREAPAASGAGREEMAEQTIPVGAPCACRCRGSAARHASPSIGGGASKGKDMLGSWSHHHVADPRAWSHHHVADVPAAYRHGHLLQGLGSLGQRWWERETQEGERYAVRLPALMDLYIHSLYVLVSKIFSSILNSPAPIHPLYHPLSTLFTVGPTCHFI